MLELLQRFSFEAQKLTKKGLLSKVKVQKEITSLEVIHFSGNRLPLPTSFNRKKSTLFVPKSPNYPGLDFFIWNYDKKVLMAFQVTVKNPFTSHPKINGASENCKLWLNFVSTKNPLEVYWIIPKSRVGTTKKFSDCVIFLEEMWGGFPALKHMKLH